MKPILFAEDATNYNNNGIGVLHDAIRCDVYEEYNGIFDVELEYPADGEWSKEIVEKRQILAKPNDVDDPHAFRIYEIEKDLEAGVIFARATTITDDLGGNLIKHVVVTDATPQQALDAIKADLIEPTIFDFVSDIQTRSSAEWTRVNPLSAIAGTDGSIVDYWGGDIKRTNNTVYLYSRRGRDKVTVITPGKNIDGFNMVTSNKGVITKVLPYYTYTPEEIPPYHMVQDYDGTWVKTQQYGEEPDVRLAEETVVGEVVVSPNAAYFPAQKYVPIDYSQDSYINDQVQAFIQQRKDEAEASPTPIDNSGFPAELKQYVTDLLNQEASGYFSYRNPGSDEPKVQIKADMITLADSEDWKIYKDLETIQVTDTVDVYVKKFNADVEVTIQSIRYDSIGERILDITAGSVKNNLVQEVNRPYIDKIKELEEYVAGLENGVYNSIGRTADGRNRRFSGYTEPPANLSTEGDLWFKEVGAGEVEIYMYTGGVWLPKVSGPEVMKRLVAMGIDAKDVTIVNLDAGSIVGGDLQVTEQFRIMHNGVPVLEVDAATGQVKITAPNLATQDDLAAKRSMVSMDEYYLASAAATGVTTTTPGWTTTPQTTDATKKYLWNYSVITYDDTTTETIGPLIIGSYGDTGPQGIQGPAGTNGQTSYFHIKYAPVSNPTSAQMTETPDVYIGTYVDYTPSDSTDPSKYTWARFTGMKGDQGIPGTNGIDGQTSYLHIAYATSADGSTGFSTTDPVGKTYIGQYTDFTSADSTTPSAYSWTKIKGEQGIQGIQGPKGADGQSLYTWIKYADDVNGTGMTDTPNGKLYMGIAYNKTTATESTTPTDYSWSLIKGEQGIPGDDGIDGTTTYTWVKYADDEYGGNMSDSPVGKRYLGLAYNKTTATESTSSSDYSWSPLYDNVDVGGRNLYIDSTLNRVVAYSNTTLTRTDSPSGDSDLIKVEPVDINTKHFGFYQDPADRTVKIDLNKPYTLSFKARGNVTDFNYTYMMRDPAEGTNSSFPAKAVTLDLVEWTEVVLYKNGPWGTQTGYILIASTDVGATVGTKWFEIKDVMFEQSNVNSTWNIAPEDIRNELDGKASNNDLDNLAGIVSDVQLGLDSKASVGEFQALKDDYDARMAQDIIDKDQLKSDLATIEGRTTLVETIANDNKLVTKFIETVITESEEGIYISNKGANTGILISSDRISFMDNDIEVAYISNQTMQINHGIFVESATISDFKFEKIPGTTILGITWVGV